MNERAFRIGLKAATTPWPEEIYWHQDGAVWSKIEYFKFREHLVLAALENYGEYCYTKKFWYPAKVLLEIEREKTL